jgi:hypothetical protein
MRKVRKRRSMGRQLVLPASMTLFAFIGVVVTSATMIIYGETIWDPVVLAGKFSSKFFVSIAMIAVAISTLATNIAANIVSPANDFANLSPKKINFKTGGFITGVIGILIFPWKLIADPTGYIFTWLVGYSSIKNGRIITATDNYVADILVEGETIKAIGKDLNVKAIKRSMLKENLFSPVVLIRMCISICLSWELIQVIIMKPEHARLCLAEQPHGNRFYFTETGKQFTQSALDEWNAEQKIIAWVIIVFTWRLPILMRIQKKRSKT